MTEYSDLKARLAAYAHDKACILCGCPALELNSRDQAICLRCLGENPLDKKGRAIIEALAAIEELEGRLTPSAMLDAYEKFMRGDGETDTSQTVMVAAVFAAAAYDKFGNNVYALGPMTRAFLIGLIDPTHHELDYLRADPASGEAARSAAKKLRAIVEPPQ